MNTRITYSDQKRAILLKRLNALLFIVITLFALLDKYLGIDFSFHVYLGFYVFTFINFILIRLGYVEICKVFALLIFNVGIFLVATSEPYSTGMYLHFVSAGTVALAMYGYEQWKGALGFVLMSLILDIITFTADLTILPFRDVDPQQAQVFFLLNTVIAAFIGVYTIMNYSKINFDSEFALQQNEKVIRQQNEQLRKANAELDRFVYSTSHDLRAPLSTLRGLINLSELESDVNLKSEYLTLMKKRIHSMDTFISEIMDYSRNNRVDLEQERVNLKDLLEEVIENLKYTDYWTETEIKWDFPDDLVVKSDKNRLHMVFTNIISNALKYYDQTKDVSWIHLKSVTNNGQVKICIADNGIGIDKDQQNQVFDMFFQAHDHSIGSGLGLYIVKETLTKLSGSISLESNVGEGSAFTINLPTNGAVTDMSMI